MGAWIATDGEAWPVSPADLAGLREELGLGPEPGAEVAGGGAGAVVLVLVGPAPGAAADRAGLVASWAVAADPGLEAPLRRVLGLGPAETVEAGVRRRLREPELALVPDGCRLAADGAVWAPEGCLGHLAEIDDSGLDPAAPATLAGLDRPLVGR